MEHLANYSHDFLTQVIKSAFKNLSHGPKPPQYLHPSYASERATVDAAKELGYDSLKDLQLAVIRGIVSMQECTHFPLFQKCE